MNTWRMLQVIQNDPRQKGRTVGELFRLGYFTEEDIDKISDHFKVPRPTTEELYDHPRTEA